MASGSSMEDVARRTGFSRTTVSYVLNGRTDVSIPAPTRATILDAAKELGYRPNGIARSLVSRKTQTIGVIVPSLQSAFHAEIVNGIQSVCAREHYRTLLAHALTDAVSEREQVELLLEHRVDGLISVSSWHGEDAVEMLAPATREGTACVLIDQRVPDLSVEHVVSDDYTGAAAAVEHLLRLGHRRIAHLSGCRRRSPAIERRRAYRQALKAAGILEDEALIVGDSFVSDEVDAWVGQLLSLPDPPTAIFAANDELAARALLALRNRGMRVPVDVALVGYGDQAMAKYLGLTTVDQSPFDMGARAAARLFERVRRPELPAEGVVIPVRLVVRETCGAKTRAC